MLFVFIILGELLRTNLFNRLQCVPPHNDIGKVNLAIKSNFTYSIWGSSTAYMNVNSAFIEKATNTPTYNFGISGAAFDQLLHLQSFAENNVNKTIIWIVNPYEFESYDYKLEASQLFFQWQDQPVIHSYFKSKSFIEGVGLKYFGWYGISKLNSKHWNYIFNSIVDIEENVNGFIGKNTSFRTVNNFYPINICKPRERRIELFRKIASEVAKKNKLIIILPPVIASISFLNFKKQIEQPEYTVIDHNENSLFKDSLLYQDNVHLNINWANILTKQIIKDLESI